MREAHELIEDARILANHIQDALNQGNYNQIRIIIAPQQQGNEVHGNLMSGATFTIKDPDGVVSIDNSLLHVAIRARVELETMEYLLPLARDHSVIVHVNSEGLTPIEYAERYFQEDDHVMDLRDTIFDYYYDIVHNYNQYLTDLVIREVHEDCVVNNSIKIDIGPVVLQNEVRSLFNSSHGIAIDIEAFIHNSNCNEAIYETQGTTITFHGNNHNIALLAELAEPD